MSARQIVGIVLIVLGTVGLVYGSIWYGRDTQTTSIGPVDIAVTEDKTFGVPVWAGVGAIIGGAVLLLMGRSDRKA